MAENLLITDESHAMEYAGHPVKVVQGSSENIKITQAEDIFLAEQILKKQAGHE
jgi:2-C-methyl-D-erythritol 4-phosphate cytidylyltransferase